MEHLAPPYLFVLYLIQELEAGAPVRVAVKKYIQETRNEFSEQLLSWYVADERGQHKLFQKQKGSMNGFRRTIFDLIDFSSRGVSILDALYSLEKELRDVSEQRLDRHLGQLPFKLMIPLLLLQFPSLLLLILGPLVFHLMREVQ